MIASVIVLKSPFNNKPNPQVELDGKPHFVARDCAVVAEVFLFHAVSQDWYVLLGKRGTGVPDYQGYWGFPCGYLDWNETLYEAVQRELWEETGLLLHETAKHDALLKSLNLPDVNGSSPMPWKITDTVREGSKQNVSHHFGFLLHWQSEMLPALSLENTAPNEAEAAEWVSIEQAKTMQMAFRHSERLLEVLNDQVSHFEHIAKP